MSDSTTPPSGKGARRRPVVLCVLDGWGWRTDRTDNAILLARTPNWNALLARWPHALLKTSGLAVGLPEGQMGNSEVGHMNLGAGRVVMQDLPRIDKAVADGSLHANPALLRFIAALKKTKGTAHMLGLLSPGGVHSHQDHMAALARILAGAGVSVRVHAFLDGRDTPPSSAQGFLAKFLDDVKGIEVRIGTIGGRYYGMDRDKRWDRVERAWVAMVDAQGPRAASAPEAVAASYAAGKTDEFMIPAVIGDYAGMKDGDGLLMANFRADRARQILTALVDPAFAGFARPRLPAFAARLGMCEYSGALNAFLETMFPPQNLSHMLGAMVSEAAMAQLRIAETEKYAHVTFFFNGGREEPFPGEDRILVPSPKVATYDLQPEMSAPEVAAKLADAIGTGRYDFVLVNFANGDMVGHTGMLDPAIHAVETIDACLGRVWTAVEAQGGAFVITADHGNVELMKDPVTHQPHTAHTTGPVPIVAAGAPAGLALADGSLCDVAPTLLTLLGLPQPAEMTGRSLFVPAADAARPPLRARA